jgi:hypothetical protein
VYQRLRERGYEVFAVNPNADEVEIDRCYHDLRSIPGGVENGGDRNAARVRRETMRGCTELGIEPCPACLRNFPQVNVSGNPDSEARSGF